MEKWNVFTRWFTWWKQWLKKKKKAGSLVRKRDWKKRKMEIESKCLAQRKTLPFQHQLNKKQKNWMHPNTGSPWTTDAKQYIQPVVKDMHTTCSYKWSQ